MFTFLCSLLLIGAATSFAQWIVGHARALDCRDYEEVAATKAAIKPISIEWFFKTHQRLPIYRARRRRPKRGMHYRSRTHRRLLRDMRE